MKHRLKIFAVRFSSVRKDLLLILFFSLATILLIEFWLIEIPAPNNFIYHLGQFTIRLGYAYFSAFIFYFLVIHLPKEKRKAKSYRQLNNKILEIDAELNNLAKTIMFRADPEFQNKKLNFSLLHLSFEEFKGFCCKVDPREKVLTQSYIPVFNDWYEYLTFIGIRIKSIINEILLINDSIDNEVLELLTFVSDETSRFIYERKKLANDSLEHLVPSLYQATIESKDLIATFRTNYKKYSSEYNHNYRQRNKKRKASP